MITTVAFDADDTLWHHEDLFISTRDRFTALLTDYHTVEWIEKHLYETELKNLRVFGYGVKGFTLSMIETAIELSEGRVTASQIQEIIDFSRDMLSAPIRLIDGVAEVLTQVRSQYRTIIVTKGDLFDQETKLARSGLAEEVDGVEIVSEKDAGTYRGVLARHGVAANEFVMVGNSMRSDILPVVEIGGHAVHVPYATEWAYDKVPDEVAADLHFHRIESLTEFPTLMQRLAKGGP